MLRTILARCILPPCSNCFCSQNLATLAHPKLSCMCTSNTDLAWICWVDNVCAAVVERPTTAVHCTTGLILIHTRITFFGGMGYRLFTECLATGVGPLAPMGGGQAIVPPSSSQVAGDYDVQAVHIISLENDSAEERPTHLHWSNRRSNLYTRIPGMYVYPRYYACHTTTPAVL